VAKRQNLNLQRCARSEPRSDADQRGEKRSKHGPERITRALDKINDFNLNEIIGRDKRFAGLIQHELDARRAAVDCPDAWVTWFYG
jgi:hypothetical protein